MKGLLLDITLGGYYVCQLKYDKHGFPLILDDGRVVEQVDYEDTKRFVEEKRPSLKGKDYRIAFTNHKV